MPAIDIEGWLGMRLEHLQTLPLHFSPSGPRRQFAYFETLHIDYALTVLFHPVVHLRAS
jgi:hypothetical protein